jgi:hypothetical protein
MDHMNHMGHFFFEPLKTDSFVPQVTKLWVRKADGVVPKMRVLDVG